jgi:hypothetical protein
VKIPIARGLTVRLATASETITGYARCSADEQDLTAQRQRLAELSVTDDRAIGCEHCGHGARAGQVQGPICRAVADGVSQKLAG